MLVLTRKPGEKVVIGQGIVVTVLSVDGGRIRLGIEAPDDVPILRGELSFFLEEVLTAGGAGAGKKSTGPA
jgi:carbon storage regulator